jgi:hypothetical protein
VVELHHLLAGPEEVANPDPTGLQRTSRSEGPVSKSSCFLGDPPPDPRFLASLGAMSSVELHHYLVVRLFLLGQLGPSYVSGRAPSSTGRSFGGGQPRSDMNARQAIPSDDLLTGPSDLSRRLI